eukprot:13068818-Alexandrium_andersonii.AAC.1
MGLASGIEPADVLERIQSGTRSVEGGETGAREGLTMAFRLSNWSRNHFKVAQDGRAATRAAI